MKNPKLSIDRVVRLWKSLSIQHSPSVTAIEISRIMGYNPIPITLLAQQSEDELVRSEAIQAYYFLMEEEMVRKSMELSIMG